MRSKTPARAADAGPQVGGATALVEGKFAARERLIAAVVIGADERAAPVSILDPTMLSRIAGFDENYLHRRLRPVG